MNNLSVIVYLAAKYYSDIVNPIIIDFFTALFANKYD